MATHNPQIPPRSSYVASRPHHSYHNSSSSLKNVTNAAASSDYYEDDEYDYDYQTNANSGNGSFRDYNNNYDSAYGSQNSVNGDRYARSTAAYTPPVAPRPLHKTNSLGSLGSLSRESYAAAAAANTPDNARHLRTSLHAAATAENARSLRTAGSLRRLNSSSSSNTSVPSPLSNNTQASSKPAPAKPTRMSVINTSTASGGSPDRYGRDPPSYSRDNSYGRETNNYSRDNNYARDSASTYAKDFPNIYGRDSARDSIPRDYTRDSAREISRDYTRDSARDTLRDYPRDSGREYSRDLSNQYSSPQAPPTISRSASYSQPARPTGQSTTFASPNSSSDSLPPSTTPKVRGYSHMATPPAPPPQQNRPKNARTRSMRKNNNRDENLLSTNTKQLEISSPYSPIHLTHVGFNADTGEFTGLPREWQELLQQSGISRKEQDEHPQAVLDIIGFYNDTTKGSDDFVWQKFGRAQANYGPPPKYQAPQQPPASSWDSPPGSWDSPPSGSWDSPSNTSANPIEKRFENPRPPPQPPVGAVAAMGPQPVGLPEKKKPPVPARPSMQFIKGQAPEPIKLNRANSQTMTVAQRLQQLESRQQSQPPTGPLPPRPTNKPLGPPPEKALPLPPRPPPKDNITVQKQPIAATVPAPNPTPIATANGASDTSNAAAPARKRDKRNPQRDAEVVERLKAICTDADPTKLYRNMVKIGQG
ncbi:hypothetical protein BC937DRAFT_94410 [Endogone sp. FLAS-F59071]|nr:hypothetical protein BC937DRAFT_94410 [Endogone sp. FLAS-F59071]|eukprot:RUS14059.1 hypothetical protein BC937DRAFT_94410 [Endogone sp. FLAS-F59071]